MRKIVTPVPRKWVLLAAIAFTSASSPSMADERYESSSSAPYDPCEVRSPRPEDSASLIDQMLSMAVLVDMAVSRDGQQLVYRTARANVETNSYCLRWYVTSVNGETSPRDIGDGGQLYSAPGAAWRDISSPPRWLATGKEFLFIKVVGRNAELWEQNIDGRQRRILGEDVTVKSYVLDSVTDSIVVEVWHRDAFQSAKRQASLGGIVYDGTYYSYGGSILEDAVKPTTFYLRVNLGTGQQQAVSASEWAKLAGGETSSWRARTNPNDGRTVEVLSGRDITPDGDETESILMVDGKMIARESKGRGIGDVWWSRDGRGIYYRAHDHWLRHDIVYIDARSGRQKIIRRGAEGEYFSFCQKSLTHDLLICKLEQSLVPGKIVAIDLRNGTTRTLAELNPDHRSSASGLTLRTLQWKNSLGDVTSAVLILPRGYAETERRLPLVVDLYANRGFLRGSGSGEVPLRALAESGIAVLAWTTHRRYSRSGIKWLPYTESQLDSVSPAMSIDSILDKLIADGIADPDRIGITGFSYGAQVAGYLISHTRKFAAASVTSASDLPGLFYYGGDGWRRSFAAQDMGTPTGATRFLYDGQSMAANAERISAALLIQAPENEHVASLATVATMRYLGKPVELVIYPDEQHMKWQPVHQLAAAQRNLDWFRFWLLNQRDDSPEKAEQYKRWEMMKAARAYADSVFPRY